MNFSLFIIVLIALFQTITDIKDVSQDSILKWKNPHNKNKIKRAKSRVNYYANCIATYNLILAGDIELNPGPGLHAKPKTPKCNVCDKAVGTNRKRVKCDVCHNLTHVSCLIDDMHAMNVYYQRYHSLRREILIHPLTPKFMIIHLQQQPTSNKNNTSIAHQNVQALMSTFNEFSLMLDEYRFDVIALSQTWRKDYKYQQNYIQLNRYNAIFKKRTNKRGGVVGFYIKDQLEYKILKNLTSKHESLEVLLIEIRGIYKNSSTLICIAYQPSSIKAEKLEWLEIFEALMTDIYTS